MSHVAVQDCVLVGNGRDWPVTIIEIRSEISTEEEKGNNDVLESIWSRIKEANKLAISTGQLRRDRLIFAKKEKSFALTGKGTVQRKATIKMYKDEIDELYKCTGSEEGFKA